MKNYKVDEMRPTVQQVGLTMANAATEYYIGKDTMGTKGTAAIIMDNKNIWSSAVDPNDKTAAYAMLDELNKMYLNGIVADSIAYGDDGENIRLEVTVKKAKKARVYGYHDITAPSVIVPKVSAFGCELETGTDDRINFELAVEEAYKIEDLKDLEEDGSLTLPESFECISQPLEDEKMYTYLKELSLVLRTNGCKCNDSCGLHFHYSRKELSRKHIQAMLLTINNVYFCLTARANRTARQLHKFAADALYNTSGLWRDFYSETVAAREPGRQGFHTEVLNLENENTIELRLFGGSVDKNYLLGAFEAFKTIIGITADEKEHTWQEMISYAQKHGFKYFIKMYKDLSQEEVDAMQQQYQKIYEEREGVEVAWTTTSIK